MLKNHHYSKWALAKSMYVAPFIAFLLLLNCKHNPQEDILTLDDKIGKSFNEIFNEGDSVSVTFTTGEMAGQEFLYVQEKEGFKMEPVKKSEDKKTETAPDNVANSNGKEEEKVYDKVDVMPEPIGGMSELYKSIRENTTYPQEARDKGVEGTVVVKFTITKEGNVSNVGVVTGVDPLLDAVAVRAVMSLSKWKPGIMHGQFVNCWYNLPITFSLQ